MLPLSTLYMGKPSTCADYMRVNTGILCTHCKVKSAPEFDLPLVQGWVGKGAWQALQRCRKSAGSLVPRPLQ